MANLPNLQSSTVVKFRKLTNLRIVQSFETDSLSLHSYDIVTNSTQPGPLLFCSCTTTPTDFSLEWHYVYIKYDSWVHTVYHLDRPSESKPGSQPRPMQQG